MSPNPNVFVINDKFYYQQIPIPSSRSVSPTSSQYSRSSSSPSLESYQAEYNGQALVANAKVLMN